MIDFLSYEDKKKVRSYKIISSEGNNMRKKKILRIILWKVNKFQSSRSCAVVCGHKMF